LSATLATTKTDLVAGDGLTFTLDVKNLGPQVATNIVATITNPTSGNMSWNVKRCTYEAPHLICRADKLEVGESTTFFAAIFIPKEKVTITASVASGSPDPNPANNRPVLDIVPQLLAKLAAEIQVTPPPMAGRTSEWRLVITNSGTRTASGSHAIWTFEG